MTTLRSVIFLLYCYAAMLWFGLSYIPAVLLVNERFLWHAMRGWGGATMWGLRVICKVDVKFEGLENVPKGPAVFASKHQAELDTILPAKFLAEPVFVVKRELMKIPVFGFYMKRMIPVDREAHAKALKDMLRAAQRVIAKGRQIVIYPEGTRQPIGAPPDYKPGIAAIYRSLNLPVTPIALNTGLSWPAHGFMRYPGTVTVRILPAIPAGLSREEFMHELETRIESACEDMLPPHLRRSVAA